MPGVTRVAGGNALPLVSTGGFKAFTMRSFQDPSRQIEVQAAQRLVTADYFDALRLRLVAVVICMLMLPKSFSERGQVMPRL